MRNKLAGAGPKKTVSLKRPSSLQQTAEHLYRHFEKNPNQKKASFMLHFRKVVIINVA